MKAKQWLVAALIVIPLALGWGAVEAQDTGWVIDSFEADYDVQANGDVRVTERLVVDFAQLERRGIFRELRTKVPCDPADAEPGALFTCPAGQTREYLVDEVRVTDGKGASLQTKLEQLGPYLNIRIGDPDKTVTGVQTYVIAYRLQGALEPFEDHDELYWNATGAEWPVPIRSTVVRVTLPSSTKLDTACFEGFGGSTDECRVQVRGTTATYRSTGALEPGEQVTIVAGWPKGVVEVPMPLLDDPVTVEDFITLDALELGGMVLVTVLGVALVSGLWWRFGRDRQYRTLYYLTNDVSEETRPLFGGPQVVVEFLPPDGLRPAQMGVVLDERADALDVTATIVDLAVRGYLHITEFPKEGWFGKADWQLTSARAADEELLPYERALLDAIFKGRSEVRVSALKNTFAPELRKVADALYADAAERRWFPMNRRLAVSIWAVAGIVLMAAGAGLAYLSGLIAARALVFAPLVPAGIALILLAPSMQRRTPIGSEALRRVLGFRLYVATAETRQQEFNEQQNIFARYLPYAIVFGCVDKWAKAFEGLATEAQASTEGWYTGVGAFQVAAFSSGLREFSSSVSSTMASTPGSSGGSSGFGGSSGGGGGGGGGGSW